MGKGMMGDEENEVRRKREEGEKRSNEEQE